MYKIKIYVVGKLSREAWLEEGIGEYTKRLQATTRLEWQWAKDNSQLMSSIDKKVIGLDPNGLSMNSENFASFLTQNLEAQGSRLSFVIGGAEGLPIEIKQSCSLVSLSPLTFTHQLTRLVLVEQLYRAMEINRGSPYHK